MAKRARDISSLPAISGEKARPKRPKIWPRDVVPALLVEGRTWSNAAGLTAYHLQVICVMKPHERARTRLFLRHERVRLCENRTGLHALAGRLLSYLAQFFWAAHVRALGGPGRVEKPGTQTAAAAATNCASRLPREWQQLRRSFGGHRAQHAQKITRLLRQKRNGRRQRETEETAGEFQGRDSPEDGGIVGLSHLDQHGPFIAGCGRGFDRAGKAMPNGAPGQDQADTRHHQGAQGMI